jgi:Tol biopolymer transport system component
MLRIAFFFLFGLMLQFEEPLSGPLIAVTPAEQDHILLYDMNGTTRTLEFGLGEIHIWDFSPDGCRVLFTRDADDNGLPKLYSAYLDGSDVQTLVNYDELPPEQWGVWEPDWSAEGVIAFTMLRDELNTRTNEFERTSHIAYIEENEVIPEFYSVTGREVTPTWSHDGAWLAYVSYDERVPGAGVFATAEPTPTPEPDAPFAEPVLLREADLWVVSADGETKYRLTYFETGSMRHPRWSPDDDLIGFIYSPSPANDTLWMVANQDGAFSTQLSDRWNLTLDHTWLPDGSAMLASIRDFRDVDQNRLWRIPLVGNADENDANIYLEDEQFTYTDFPRFSADGRYLALRSGYGVYVVDVAAMTWQQVEAALPGNTPPVWSPAGFEDEEACYGRG